ncbi:hypothetical protein HDU91_001424 [Kappamyces sp. JEL0680]|nr:hypothetical protein HDU91_001424 [Kappamyces sp. JEL0680]
MSETRLATQMTSSSCINCGLKRGLKANIPVPNSSKQTKQRAASSLHRGDAENASELSLATSAQTQSDMAGVEAAVSGESQPATNLFCNGNRNGKSCSNCIRDNLVCFFRPIQIRALPLARYGDGYKVKKRIRATAHGNRFRGELAAIPQARGRVPLVRLWDHPSYNDKISFWPTVRRWLVHL